MAAAVTANIRTQFTCGGFDLFHSFGAVAFVVMIGMTQRDVGLAEQFDRARSGQSRGSEIEQRGGYEAEGKESDDSHNSMHQHCCRRRAAARVGYNAPTVPVDRDCLLCRLYANQGYTVTRYLGFELGSKRSKILLAPQITHLLAPGEPELCPFGRDIAFHLAAVKQADGF